MRTSTKQAARGKWDGIINELVGENAISRKHTACPICGGKDRYRYDNKHDNGDWFCNFCGAGDGFKLIMESLVLSFSDVAKMIDQIVNNIEAKPFTEEIKTDTEKRRIKMNSIWSRADNLDIAHDYLIKRGVPISSLSGPILDVKGTRSLALYEDGRETYHPAMLSLIRNSEGQPTSIHRTYLLPDNKTSKKIMPPITSVSGGSIHLGTPNKTLVLAEGIETALAGWAYTGHPAWATISANNLEKITKVPESVKKIIICADNDLSFTGQASAFKAASYMRNRLKLKVEVLMPRHAGFDMLDFMNNQISAENLWGWNSE